MKYLQFSFRPCWRVKINANNLTRNQNENVKEITLQPKTYLWLSILEIALFLTFFIHIYYPD
jgi:hypothetical protein